MGGRQGPICLRPSRGPDRADEVRWAGKGTRHSQGHGGCERPVHPRPRENPRPPEYSLRLRRPTRHGRRRDGLQPDGTPPDGQPEWRAPLDRDLPAERRHPLSNAQAIADAQRPAPRQSARTTPAAAKRKRPASPSSTAETPIRWPNHTGLSQKDAETTRPANFSPPTRASSGGCSRQPSTPPRRKTARTFFGRIRHLHRSSRPPPKPPRGTPKSTPESKAYWRYLQDKARGEREAINHPFKAPPPMSSNMPSPHSTPPSPPMVPVRLPTHPLDARRNRVLLPPPTGSDDRPPSHRRPHHPPPPLACPLTVDAEIGSSWGTLVPYAQWLDTDRPLEHPPV